MSETVAPDAGDSLPGEVPLRSSNGDASASVDLAPATSPPSLGSTSHERTSFLSANRSRSSSARLLAGSAAAPAPGRPLVRVDSALTQAVVASLRAPRPMVQEHASTTTASSAPHHLHKVPVARKLSAPETPAPVRQLSGGSVASDCDSDDSQSVTPAAMPLPPKPRPAFTRMHTIASSAPATRLTKQHYAAESYDDKAGGQGHEADRIHPFGAGPASSTHAKHDSIDGGADAHRKPLRVVDNVMRQQSARKVSNASGHFRVLRVQSVLPMRGPHHPHKLSNPEVDSSYASPSIAGDADDVQRQGLMRKIMKRLPSFSLLGLSQGDRDGGDPSSTTDELGDAATASDLRKTSFRAWSVALRAVILALLAATAAYVDSAVTLDDASWNYNLGLALRLTTAVLVLFKIVCRVGATFSAVPTHRRFYRRLGLVAQLGVGITVPLPQVLADTEAESFMNLAVFCAFLACAEASPFLFFPYSAVYFLGTCVIFIAGTVSARFQRPDLFHNQEIFSAHLILAFCAAFVVMEAHLSRDSRAKRISLYREKVKTLIEETKSLKSELFKLMIDTDKDRAPHQDPASIDLETPLEKVLSTLKRLLMDPDLSDETRTGVREAISILSSKGEQLFQPHRLQAQVDQLARNSDIDSETVSWIKETLHMGSARAGSTGSIDQAHRDGSLISAHASMSRSELSTVLPSSNGSALELDQLLRQLDSWDFPIFELSDLTNGRPLFALGVTLFHRYDLTQHFNIDTQKLMNFLEMIERGYNKAKNPYHNSTHGADVLQSTHILLQLARDGDANIFAYLSDVEVLALLLAAVVHDYDHPGYSNAFLIGTRDPMAVTYNDRSVLENHHVSSAFALMQRPECNILENLSGDQLKEVRSAVIELVLCTDLGHHFDVISNFKSRLQLGPYTHETPESRLMVMKMALKASDIGHPTKERELHLQWTGKITEEFFHQGDVERTRGLPVSAFMDRENANVPQSQVGFIDFLVKPLFDSFALYMRSTPMADSMLAQLAANRQHWKTIVDHASLKSSGGGAAGADAAAAKPVPAAGVRTSADSILTGPSGRNCIEGTTPKLSRPTALDMDTLHPDGLASDASPRGPILYLPTDTGVAQVPTAPSCTAEL